MNKALSLILATLIAVPVAASDPQNGKKLSRKCSVCHGQLGIARDPEVPHLAGQSARYIEKSIMDFQKGERQDRRMSLIVKNLSKDGYQGSGGVVFILGAKRCGPKCELNRRHVTLAIK